MGSPTSANGLTRNSFAHAQNLSATARVVNSSQKRGLPANARSRHHQSHHGWSTWYAKVPLAGRVRASSLSRSSKALRLSLVAFCALCITPALNAQTLGSSPAASPSNDPGSIARTEEARLKAEREAAERAAREAQPQVRLGGAATPVLGAFPQEQPCFALREIAVRGADHGKLDWVPSFVQRHIGKCVGAAGLDYMLRELQAAFLDRGLVTTRAGFAEQDISDGSLEVDVIGGTVASVRVNGKDRPRAWQWAAPLDKGDVISLRALEQGVEQLKRIPGREAKVDLVPGANPGETILDVSVSDKRPFALSLSLNNFAGPNVGRWQGSGQIAALNLLGLSEILSASYNRRINAPGLPADSQGSGVSLSLPFGWWTFGASFSANRYGSRVEGEVADFDTSGKLRSASLYAERVIARDQLSRTSLRFAGSRRWARNFINDIEIGIQRQDLADVEVALIDRRQIDNLRMSSSVSFRAGLNILGAQDEPSDRPDVLPTARYRILSADVSLSHPIDSPVFESWRADFHGQYSKKPLYGSDLISAGGPFSLRGISSETAELGRTGWFVRQELGLKVSDDMKPFLLIDAGKVKGGSGLKSTIGAGMRAMRHGFTLDAFAALQLTGRNDATGDQARKPVQLGVSLGWSL